MVSERLRGRIVGFKTLWFWFCDICRGRVGGRPACQPPPQYTKAEIVDSEECGQKSQKSYIFICPEPGNAVQIIAILPPKSLCTGSSGGIPAAPGNSQRKCLSSLKSQRKCLCSLNSQECVTESNTPSHFQRFFTLPTLLHTFEDTCVYQHHNKGSNQLRRT